MQRQRRLAAGCLLVLGVGLAAWVVSPTVALSKFEALAGRPLVFTTVILSVALVRSLCAWPTLVLSVAIGYAYGMVGLPLALLGLVLTSLLPYWFGTTIGTGRLTDAGRTLLAETGGVRGVAAARLLPVPSDAISVGAGAVDVPLKPYLLGTLVGELPWAILGLLVGRSVDQLSVSTLSDVVDPWLVVGLTAVAVLLLAGPCYRVVATRWSLDVPAVE